MQVMCEWCGKVFNRAPAQIKQHIFCGQPCRIEWRKLNPMSPETRQRIGAVHRGKPKSVQHRQQISKALFGKPLSEERKRHMRSAHKHGAESHNWVGDSVSDSAAYKRCISMFPLEPCEVCGALPGGHKVHRHHKDGDPTHNVRDNIAFLCTKHHIEAHGGTWLQKRARESEKCLQSRV